MSILRYEGFDHETAAEDLYAGILSTLIVTGSNQSAKMGLSAITQYSAGQCLAVTASSTLNTGANAMAVMPIAPASNTVIVGAAVSLSASIGNGAVIGFVNANVGQVYCYISAGAVKVFCGDPTITAVQLGSTVNSVVASLGWAYVEMQAVIASDMTGSVLVKINGSTVYNQSGLITSNDGTTDVNGVLLGTANISQTISGFTSYFDDVYVNDSIGTAPYNTFLGPVRVVTQFPSANGSSTNFTGLAHHSNWQNVSEAVMDSDATYNYSNQTGSIDTFVAAALPGSASGVYAVKVTGAGRIDDSGIRTVQTILESGSTISVGNNVNLVGSYQYFSDTYTLDPNTNMAWTPSGVNLVQFGYKIVPSPGSPIALAALTINITFTGVASQFTTMAGIASIGDFVALIATILPIEASLSESIGTIKILASAQQGVSASSTITITLQGSSTLSAGLQANGVISIISINQSIMLLQICNASATVSIIPVGSAGINQGLGATSKITVRLAAQGAVSQYVNASGKAGLLIKASSTSVQGVLISGTGRLSAFSMVGTISTANASNIHIGLSNWLANYAYALKARVASNGNAYQCISAGTSDAVALSGTGSSITDGGAQWKYLSHIDFSNLTAWGNSIPATLTQPVLGLLWNDGTITTTAGTAFLTLGNPSAPRVTSSVNTITLRPAPGEGIRDFLAGGSTALAFNAANGVSFTLPAGTGGINYFDVNDGNVIFNGLQFRDPNATSGSTIVQQENSSSAFTLTNCIIDGYGQSGGAYMIQGGTGKFTMTNCLVIDRQNNSAAFSACTAIQSATTSLVNCTIVALATPGANGGGVLDNSAAAVIRNCIIMGYTDGLSIPGGGGAIALVDHCLFSTLTAGNAAIDKGNNLNSKTVANQFTNATNDFRLKVGADALNAAVTDTVNIPTSDDIAGTHRPVSTAWDIGCYE